MKLRKLIPLALIALAFCNTTVAAQTGLQDANNIFPNLIQDPGFENGGYGWTASGGATKTANTTAKGTGSKGYDWDSNAASQTLDSASITIPAGYYGRNGLAYCNIKTPSGTATHTLTVYDGSNNLFTPVTITSNTVFTNNPVNFIFPSSGSVKLRLTSVASNEPEIYIDDCYLGLADNLTSVSQSKFIGSAYIATTASCTWSRANTALGAFGTTSACPGPTVESNPGPGTIQTTDTDLPKFTVNNLPPGTYRVIISGEAGISGGTNHNSYTISDGTTTSGRGNGSQVSNGAYAGMVVEGWFTYTTTANQTFELYGSAVGNTAIIDNAAGNNRLQFSIVQFPSQSQVAVSSAQGDYDWTAYTPTIGSGAGTATSISFYHKRVNGDLYVKGRFTTGTAAASLVSITLPNSLTLDTNRISASNTTSNPGEKVGDFVGGTTASHAGAIVTATGTSTSLVYFGNLYANGTNLTPTNGSTNLANSEIQTVTFIVPISGWNTTQRAPVLVGSVTSLSTGAERIERYLTSTSCSTTCTATSSTPGISSITGNASGQYSVTFAASTWSAAPVCFVTALEQNGGNHYVQGIGAATTSSWTFQIIKSATSVTEPDAFQMICMGPK